MQLNGNTIFVTGATSGIGRGLAEAFHQRGNQVLLSGRREDRLREICRRHPGMRYFVLDVTDREAVRRVCALAMEEFPGLNCVFNNAGVQMSFDFASTDPLDDQALLREINTNLLGAIRVAAAFLPRLRGRQGATLVNVSSGLAFVPMARFPVYCATKAAIHSWTLCLRHQLSNAGVKVIELIPPYVATELGGPGKLAQDIGGGRRPMPLESFIAETMQELATDADEIAIADAKNLAAAACPEAVRKVFSGMNRER